MQHPGLINEAATVVERWRVEGYLGKRAQAVRNPPRLAPPVRSNLSSDAQRSGGLSRKGFRCANISIEMEREMIVGYARVSTDGQTLDAQQAALISAGS